MRAEFTEYLKLLVVEGRYIPGLKATKTTNVRNRLPPLFSFALIARLNKELRSHEWIIAEDAVDKLSWTRTEFANAMQAESEWVGTGPQLDDTIKKYASLGYMSVTKTNLVPSKKLIELLLNHAHELYPYLVKKQPPEWTLEKGSWLDFNATVFDFLLAVNKQWRPVRVQVHDAISKAKGRRRGWNSLGQNFGYWIVLQLVGMNEAMDEWSVEFQARQYGLAEWVLTPDAVGKAQKDLVAFKILTREEGVLRIAPAFMDNYERYLSGIADLLPPFVRKCETWQSDDSVPSPKTLLQRQ